MKIGVLGLSGMLGSNLYRHFKSTGWAISGTQRRSTMRASYLNLDDRDYVTQLVKFIEDEKIQILINCIAVTHVRDDDAASAHKAFFVNGDFPWILDEVAKNHAVQVINTSSDGVFQVNHREVNEDTPCDGTTVYAKSKIKGEVISENSLVVRTSIIGIDQDDSKVKHLMSWFLSHPDGAEVRGFSNHLWQGVTTRQLAQYYAHIIEMRLLNKLIDKAPVVHFVPNPPLSKYKLLKLMNEKFRRKIRVVPVDAPESVTRVLMSQWAATYPPGMPHHLAGALDEMYDLYF